MAVRTPVVGELYLDLPVADGPFVALTLHGEPVELVREVQIGPALIAAVRSGVVWFVPIRFESDFDPGQFNRLMDAMQAGGHGWLSLTPISQFQNESMAACLLQPISIKLDTFLLLESTSLGHMTGPDRLALVGALISIFE
jgi:hypothetical protein